MRSFTRRSPSIRSPSLLQSSSLPISPSSSSSQNQLPRRLTLLLRGIIALLVFWYELGTFWIDAEKGWTCFDEPSSSAPSTSTSTPRQRQDNEEGFKVLLVTDPQLLDMERSYEGRNRGLKWLSIEVTNRFMRKSWKFLTRRGGTRGIDAVVWNGDLLDNGREMRDSTTYDGYTSQFHRFFPLPRQKPTSFTSSSSSSTELDPPVPVIYVPGNHDLTLHPSLSTNSTQSTLPESGRKRFETSFGPLWGEREFEGWNLVWIDSIALIEQSFWNGNEQFGDMRGWLEELGRRRSQKEEEEKPRILFTHIPLYRPEGTNCGERRESRRWGGGIRDRFGKGYQNLVGEMETRWLLERVRPRKVISGDDHDYCYVEHRYGDGEGETVTETTVKSFSMAMGVSNPGYTILPLYPPVVNSDSSSSSLSTNSASFTEQSCLLPSQLVIYLHVYLPLSISLFLFFLVPRLAKVGRRFLKRWRKSRRRTNGKSTKGPSNRRGGGGGGGGGLRWKRGNEKAGDVEQEEEIEEDGIFPTFSNASNGVMGSEYGYSANLDDGGVEGGGGAGEPISNRPTNLRRNFEEDDESTSDSDESEKEGRTRERGRRPSKVRRVSRVWLWEKDSSSSSSILSTPKFSTTASLPQYSPYDDPNDHESLTLRLKDLAQRILHRLSQNSLLLPLLRLLRPVVRLVRTILFVVLGKPLEWITRLLGGEKGIARAFKDAAREFWGVTWIGITLWIVVWIWVGM